MSVAARRAREREQRRGHILDAAQRVFWERGFDAAKMEDIADAAQLGKGTLYLYFRTKDDLALGLAMRHQRAMIERFEALGEEEGDARQVLRSLLLAYAERMTTPLEHLKLAMGRWTAGVPFDAETKGGAQALANVERLMAIVCEAVERAQAQGAIRADIEAGQLAVFLWSSVNGALLLRLKLACFGETAPMAKHVLCLGEHVDLLLESMRPHGGERPSHERRKLRRNREAS